MSVRSEEFDLSLITSDVMILDVDEINEDAQDTALEYVVIRWPVATGESRNGWFIEPIGFLRWRLANDVDYTEHVHDGIWFRLTEDALAEARKEAERAAS